MCRLIWLCTQHCRKCGGVFCGDCSARFTALLDTTHLPFVHPPKDVPIRTYESPNAPVIEARVCDDCYDQIFGAKTLRLSPLLKSSDPIGVVAKDGDQSSVSSASPSVVATPLDGFPPVSVLHGRPAIRRAHTSSPRLPHSPLRPSSASSSTRSTNSPAHSVSGAYAPYHYTHHAHLPLSTSPDDDAELGELAAYPLRYASSVCKAMGGGRWVPKPVPQVIGYSLPGTKAPYEIELEKEEEEKKKRGATPILRDGDIMIRVPFELAPRSPGGPRKLATF